MVTFITAWLRAVLLLSTMKYVGDEGGGVVWRWGARGWVTTRDGEEKPMKSKKAWKTKKKM